MDKIVTTFDGTKAAKTECRYIKGDFFIKNVQCFQINDRWYRINSGYIVYDHSTKEYVLKSNELEYGIIGGTPDNWEMGYFRNNEVENVELLVNGDLVKVIREDIMTQNNCKEISSGASDFFAMPDAKLLGLGESMPYKRFQNLPYNCRGLLKTTAISFAENYSPLKKEEEYAKYITPNSKVIGTFGVEFETNGGRLPHRFVKRLGLMPLRDGSINGDEYVTIPLSCNKRDVNALEDACNVLSKYTSFSKDNSQHVHLKITEFSKEFFVAAYVLNLALQEEIYSLFAKYAASTDKYKSNGKNYNAPLPRGIIGVENSLEHSFESLYQYYSGGHSFASRGNSTAIGHPNDRDGNHKWNVGVRYIFCNFTPLLFNGSNTVEYRIHPPTNNFHKLWAWIALINGILQYAQTIASTVKNTAELVKLCKDITLMDVTSTVYSKEDPATCSLIEQYVNYRRKLRAEMDSKEDYIGITEFNKDNEFIPEF